MVHGWYSQLVLKCNTDNMADHRARHVPAHRTRHRRFDALPTPQHRAAPLLDGEPRRGAHRGREAVHGARESTHDDAERPRSRATSATRVLIRRRSDARDSTITTSTE